MDSRLKNSESIILKNPVGIQGLAPAYQKFCAPVNNRRSQTLLLKECYITNFLTYFLSPSFHCVFHARLFGKT